jgi:hypothetical protein
VLGTSTPGGAARKAATTTGTTEAGMDPIQVANFDQELGVAIVIV